jgi:6-phosphogluconolactonase (cycloisomerase 2 family)
MYYRVADGRLERIGETSVDAGAGPRHMALHPTRYSALVLGQGIWHSTQQGTQH